MGYKLRDVEVAGFQGHTVAVLIFLGWIFLGFMHSKGCVKLSCRVPESNMIRLGYNIPDMQRSAPELLGFIPRYTELQ